MSTNRTITSENLFTDTSAAELFTEMLKTFMLDMLAEREEVRVAQKKGSDDNPEGLEQARAAFDDILEASGMILMEANKYRANPETKFEIALDMSMSDD